ncbi:hypothetical protein F7U70_003595 [Vibrio fluvialis]|nr:hypothetical protein [Vibrio fluvialis]MBY7981992.1 hypothetical protein [Vibrio fluvialis]
MIELVKIFREILSNQISTLGNQVVPQDLRNFPAGTCEVSSVMLMTYLNSVGYKGISYISGSRPTGDPGKESSHSCLKVNGKFLDITCSQFDECDELIIYAKSHPLLNTFSFTDNGFTDIYEYSNDGIIDYVPVYEAVLERMPST